MNGEIIAAVDHKMARAVEVMERDLQNIRTGRASTGLVERIGVRVFCVPGAEAAMKITRPADLATAERLLRASSSDACGAESGSNA